MGSRIVYQRGTAANCRPAVTGVGVPGAVLLPLKVVLYQPIRTVAAYCGSEVENGQIPVVEAYVEAYEQQAAIHRSAILGATILLARSGMLVAQQTGAPSIPDLMSMDIESLMKMEVTTASRFSDKLAAAPSIMSVVTSDELRRFGGLTLNEILQRVPGLTGTTQYFSDRSMVAADGDQSKTDGGHILFLINGRPTREVMEGGMISDLLESFPVDILERIEVIRGPGSVLYGSNAFSAVINLITKKAKTNAATVKGQGGAGGAVDATGSFSYTHGNLSAVGDVQRHALADWPTTYLVPPSQQNLSFAPAVPPVEKITVADRGVGAYRGLDYKGLSFMSSFTEWQSTGFIEGTVSPTRQTRAFGNLGYDRKVGPKWDMSFNLTFTRTTFRENPFPNVTRDSNESIAEWTNLITLTSRDRLSVGGLFNRIGAKSCSPASPPPPSRRWAAGWVAPCMLRSTMSCLTI